VGRATRPASQLPGGAGLISTSSRRQSRREPGLPPVRRLQTVPERLDRVAIATSREVIELSWASRDSLLHEIRNLGESAKPIRAAFEAVGASRPVELSRAEQSRLFSAIDLWADSVTVAALPPGIWRLRCALADQLGDAPAA
jgi:hypothetical protein